MQEFWNWTTLVTKINTQLRLSYTFFLYLLALPSSVRDTSPCCGTTLVTESILNFIYLVLFTYLFCPCLALLYFYVSVHDTGPCCKTTLVTKSILNFVYLILFTYLFCPCLALLCFHVFVCDTGPCCGKVSTPIRTQNTTILLVGYSLCSKRFLANRCLQPDDSPCKFYCFRFQAN
jgi:hypothetical protein